ncbi:hypothetical protein F6R98_17630 [Candidatus Methylospira mobilis]|uniref:Uncharacterized protein n=1 Tax=Candidatus Methylospira mobilis TaxID=1808979 RepID=A0A5Q0BKW5_9GAMM|nr:hypothetical protein [Candidatus Methylospira mobilis]QFY44229.1 hypothetical protein F6R98_17630 [Candidatus Methylospira mobilis]WNV06346.1 hypothetical protein RP726_08045 [Candidatus Methylospira mobilis]
MPIPHEKNQPEQTVRRNFSVEALNNIVQTLAIVMAGAWGVYTFVYQAKIAPSLEPPTISVTSTLEKAGQKGSLIALRSTVTRHNVGQTGVRVLGFTYNIVGIKTRFSAGAEVNEKFDQDLTRSSSVNAARYYDDSQQHEVILRQGKLFEGATTLPSSPSSLNPGEKVSRDMIFYADNTQFDSIRFQVSLWYSKDSDPPVPLALEIDDHGQLSAMPDSDCKTDPDPCSALNSTDFTTEFSLW